MDRHPFPGPGLAIRVICAQEPYIESDFGETQVLLRLIVEFNQIIKKVHNAISEFKNSKDQSDNGWNCTGFHRVMP